MKLEQQVTNFELSKKLKELGVKQESLFYWHKVYNGSWRIITKAEKSKNEISAFLASELGEILPSKLDYPEGYKLTCTKEETIWRIKYNSIYKHDKYEVFSDENLANAMAKMLIYLLKNKLISL